MSATGGYSTPTAPSAPPMPPPLSSWSQSQSDNPYGGRPQPWSQQAGAYVYPPAGAGVPYGWGNSSNQGYPLFPVGTDPEIVRWFQMADVDGSGSIDDRELQRVLSSSNHSFSLRTVHLLMFLFSNNTTRIGPKEFAALWNCIREWRVIFERFDRDRSGKIDSIELRDALLSLGYAISPSILQVLVSKYDRTGQARAIDYDNFIECGIIVKGLTDKFKEKDTRYTGSATLTYETFMFMVLPFIVA